jgi:SAM-dependent methyltransferase
MRRLLISLLKGLNFLVRKVSAFTHYAQYAVQWGIEPKPEWFDHFLDQHWQFSATNNGLWVEHGVFSRLVLKPNARMLEICCGDGFNARHFYSSKASSIIALDFDKDAIPHAKRYNSAPNITYIRQDIREGMPAGPFDNIVWDAAIEHFTETEIDKIMRELVQRLGPDGILSGYTLTALPDGRKSNALHEYEFKDKDDLFLHTAFQIREGVGDDLSDAAQSVFCRVSIAHRGLWLRLRVAFSRASAAKPRNLKIDLGKTRVFTGADHRLPPAGSVQSVMFIGAG